LRKKNRKLISEQEIVRERLGLENTPYNEMSIENERKERERNAKLKRQRTEREESERKRREKFISNTSKR